MRYSVLSKYRSELMGVAMLWILFYHAWGLNVGSGVLNLIKSTGFGGVDIFIILSAMGLVVSLSRKEQKFLPFMGRRALRILPAFFIVLLPYAILAVLRGKISLASLFWNCTLLAYWVRADWIFNWYIPGILLFYALTPFCFHLLQRFRHRTLLTVIGIVAGLILCQILMKQIWGWGYMDVFYRIPVFFLGLLIGFYVRDNRSIGKKGAVFWCLLAACGGIYLYISEQVTSHILQFPLCHLFLFSSVPVCLLFSLLFEHLPLGGLRKILRLIGENSLEIYLLNVCFVLEAAFLQRFLNVGPGYYIYYLITIPLNILLGVLLHHIIAWGTARLHTLGSAG